MSQQFVFLGQAAEVKTDHLVGPQRRLAARGQRDQQAGDNRTVGLNLNSHGVVTEQMAAPQHMLEEAKEQLDRPAIMVKHPDQFGRHVEQVRGQHQHRGRLVARAAFGVRRQPHMHDPHGMIRMLDPLRLRRAQVAHGVVGHPGGNVGIGQGPLFPRHERMVLAHAANVVAADGRDGVEQRKLLVASIHHITSARLQVGSEHGFFVGRVAVAGIGQVHAGGRVFEDFELGVQAAGRFFGGLRFVGQGGDAGQRRQQRAVNQCHDAIELGQSRVASDGRQPVGNLADDLPQPLGLEDLNGLGQRTERSSRTAQQFLHFAQRAGLLQPAERFDHRVEEVEQDQQAVLIEMQLPVARLVRRNQRRATVRATAQDAGNI